MLRRPGGGDGGAEGAMEAKAPREALEDVAE